MTVTSAGNPITPAPVTRQLGAFVASMGTRNIPAEAFEVAKLGFTDCIGTMLAGRQAHIGKRLVCVLCVVNAPSCVPGSGGNRE